MRLPIQGWIIRHCDCGCRCRFLERGGSGYRRLMLGRIGRWNQFYSLRLLRN